MRLFFVYLAALVFFTPFAYSQEDAAALPDNPWRVHDPASLVTVDHASWNTILKSLVLERQTIIEIARSQNSNSRTLRETRLKKGMDINYVPYALIKKEFGQILFVLEIYISEMREVGVSKLNRDEQLAYWLNLRNALVMHSLFYHHPVTDIEELYYGDRAGNSEWDTKKVWVEAKLLSIRDIEETIVLAGWPDPRVLYGLFYGAKGGPFIMNQAFTGANVYGLLEANAREYLNASKTIKVSRKRGLEVPLVFYWHAALFGEDSGALYRHLEQYAGDKLLKKLSKAPRDKISYAFDWEINDIPSRIGDFNLGQMYLGTSLANACVNSSSGLCALNSIYNSRTMLPRAQ